MSGDAIAVVPGEVAVDLQRAGRGDLLRSFWRDKAAFAGTIFILLLVVMAVFAPWIAPHSPSTPDLFIRLQPPAWQAGGSWSYPLGTDALGRDELSRLIYGARLSLLIAVSVVVTSGAVGTILGLIAGYKGGRLDAVIMRLADAQLAFPGLLLVLLVLASFGSSVPLIIAVLAVYGWMIFARLVRGMVLQLRQGAAVQAAEMIGCSTPRILFRHLLPSLYSALLAQAMLETARIVLAEASLSYLGLGVQPPSSSWGLMVAESQSYIRDAWWAVVFPGVALSLTVIAINLVANWLRVQADPQQRQRRFAAAAVVTGEDVEASPGEDAAPVEAGDATPAGRRDVAAGEVRGAPAEVRDAPGEVRGAPAEVRDPPVLDVKRLSVRFHTVGGTIDAVQDVSFAIRSGETLGIVGESGSGKSTVALALIDLVPPPGRIEHADVDWQGKPVDRAGLAGLRGSEITMIFQDPMTSLNPLVPVGRQVGETLVKHRGMSRRAARERTRELFSLVGIPSPDERLDQYPHELSGGLRQRIMIAAALAPEPKLIVADEPTTALDATIQAQILDLIADLQQRLDIAMLLISHDLGVIARMCDRVAVMYGGAIAEDAAARTIFHAPEHRYTEALLAAVPRAEGGDQDLVTIPGRPPPRPQRGGGCPFAPRCAFAQDDCARMPPFVVAGDDHRYACWHPAGGGS